MDLTERKMNKFNLKEDIDYSIFFKEETVIKSGDKKFSLIIQFINTEEIIELKKIGWEKEHKFYSYNNVIKCF